MAAMRQVEIGFLLSYSKGSRRWTPYFASRTSIPFGTERPFRLRIWAAIFRTGEYTIVPESYSCLLSEKRIRA